MDTRRAVAVPCTDDWSLVWARSGAQPLSGHADGPPLPVPQMMVRAVTQAATAIAELTSGVRPVVVDGPALLAERAAIIGHHRRGSVSCGGASRLVRAADGWIALSLARDSDLELLPAWLEQPVDPAAEDVWSYVSGAVSARPAAALVERAALLGLACGRCGERRPGKEIVLERLLDGRRVPAPIRDLVVVDLSSLWAGPLCAHLLGLAGARVVKVESATRPDGGREGPREFFDLLHGGHESVVLDFTDRSDVAILRRLVRRADVVIESSRPRALAHLGISPESDAGGIWLSITGHGREGPDAHRVGFGDDAAIAGGLATFDSDGPCFCADAVADPVTGLIAAAAVLDRLQRRQEGRWLLDVALARTAAALAGGTLTTEVAEPPAQPRSRPVTTAARPLGADTEHVLRDLAIVG